MRRALRLIGRGQTGFTLVELLVAVVILSSLMAAVVSTVLVAQRSAETSITDHDVTEEARLALNRVSRELRQATTIARAVNPQGAGYNPDAISAITFEADFNGDGCIDGVAPAGFTGTCQPDNPADPELLSYCHEPTAIAVGAPRLYILDAPLPAGSLTSCSGGQPILAELVTTFRLDYRSNEYRYDANADGVTTWEELDAAILPYGDGNGVLNDVELAHIDSIVIHLALAADDERDFQTQVALRNLV
jgi:prepilin-type N-terminal cleavage/methylation domain-containing protein